MTMKGKKRRKRNRRREARAWCEERRSEEVGEIFVVVNMHQLRELRLPYVGVFRVALRKEGKERGRETKAKKTSWVSKRLGRSNKKERDLKMSIHNDNRKSRRTSREQRLGWRRRRGRRRRRMRRCGRGRRGGGC
jgi:hypothetical protein